MLDRSVNCYGNCPCGGRYSQRTITANMTNRDVVIPDVPQGYCPVCGGRVYLMAHLELLEAAYSGRPVEPRL